MSPRPARRRPSTGPAVLLLPVVLAFAGCASVAGYQKAEAQYDRQSQQNRKLARQYSQEISELTARRTAYQQALADEARLTAENARLQQRIATLPAAATGRPPARPAAPNAGLQELGQAITARTFGLMQKELRDYGNLESLYNRQLQALSSLQAGSPEYRREAGRARAQALLDVISEALLTAGVPRDLLRASPPAGDSSFEQALTTLADAQDRMIVALNDFKLQGRERSDGTASRAQAGCRDLLAAITDVTGHLGRTPLGKDPIARLGALREITEIASVLLTTTDALPALKGHPPVARLISSLLAAQETSGAAAARRPTSSEIRSLNRMEWIMTMGTYCQAEAFRPESYLQMRLGEIRPLTAAVREIVASYERSHRENVKVKGADSLELAKEPTSGFRRSKADEVRF